MMSYRYVFVVTNINQNLGTLFLNPNDLFWVTQTLYENLFFFLHKIIIVIFGKDNEGIMGK